MVKNKITSDMINRRLGGGGGWQPPPDEPEGFGDAGEVESAGSGAGFMAAMFVLFLLVGGGTFYFAGSGLSLDNISLNNIQTAFAGDEDFVSASGAECDKLWVENARNDPAISCYLTTNVSRLCDPRERAHLAGKFKTYKHQSTVFETQIVLTGLRTSIALQNQMGGQAQGMFTSLDNQINGKGTKKDLQAVEKWTNSLENIQDHNLDAAFALKKVPDSSIVQMIRTLGESGYMTKWDFGWWTDSTVARAFDRLEVKESSCRG